MVFNVLHLSIEKSNESIKRNYSTFYPLSLGIIDPVYLSLTTLSVATRNRLVT